MFPIEGAPDCLHGWRDVLLVVDAGRLQRSVRLLSRGGDKDLHSSLEVVLIARHVANNRSVQRHRNLLSPVFKLEYQHLSLGLSDSLFHIAVCHGALRPEVPRVVSFAGSGKMCTSTAR